MSTVLAGQDCLAILPTGGGKSLCFQLPGLLFPGITIVISPLISLMTDQVMQLTQKGISAVALTSMLSSQEQQITLSKLQQHEYRFIYVSPEKLVTAQFIHALQGVRISQVVIDEAHCISEWGHQFRPQYLQIRSFVSALPYRPVIAAFTASSTPATTKDIIAQLGLEQPKFFRQSVYRSNLSLHVISCPTHTVQQLVMRRLLKKFKDQPIILYCATRIHTQDVATILQSSGLLAAAYHAGLSSEERQDIQHRFLSNQLNIICATTAFGMGVDKPNIRAVIHLNLPASLEGYYQEVGRAGRDGQPSWCYLLMLPGDDQLQAEIISRSYPPAECSDAVIHFLETKPKLKTLLLRDLTAHLSRRNLDSELWITLHRGEEQHWWKVDWKTRTLFILQSRSSIKNHKYRLHQLQLHQLQKLLAMKEFCFTTRCRQRQLVMYFEPLSELHRSLQCRQCDQCTHESHGTPSLSELQYFKKLSRRFRALSRRKKAPLLAEICLQLLASYQPAQISDLEWMSTFGRGWQKEWATLTASKKDPQLGKDPRQQILADGSTHESQLKKLPPTW